jgi:hypothetical protein
LATDNPQPQGAAGDAPNRLGDTEKLPEPSMGPACLVIVILMLAAGSAFCAFSSFFMFSDQHKLAERGITEALMPWIEQSQLAPQDKREILASLEDLLVQVRSRELTSRQLSRLKNALEDNPVLLWGVVEGVLAQGPAAGLNATEQMAAERVAQRLLRAAAERRLSRNDLEFTLQPAVRNRTDNLGIEPQVPLAAPELREFIKRAEAMADNYKIPDEPYEKSVHAVFQGLLDEALQVK